MMLRLAIRIGSILIEHPTPRLLRITAPADPAIDAALARLASRDGRRSRGPRSWWAPARNLRALEAALRPLVEPLFP